jgi:hypothetical protein
MAGQHHFIGFQVGGGEHHGKWPQTPAYMFLGLTVFFSVCLQHFIMIG